MEPYQGAANGPGRHRAVSDQERMQFTSQASNDLPQPARDELDKPPLNAEDLKKEIGDSEIWDPASQDNSSGEPAT